MQYNTSGTKNNTRYDIVRETDPSSEEVESAESLVQEFTYDQ